MKQRWILTLIILPLLVSACRAGAGPAERVVIATFTSTPFLNMEAMAERTYTPTLAPTATLTPLPSATPTQPEATAVSSARVTGVEITATQLAATEVTQAAPSPTSPPASLNAEAPESGRYFIIQEGAPVGMPAWDHQDEGCAWLGVAGQVFDLDGNPELDLVVEAGGTLEGQLLLGLSITGLASAYGPGGYEIQLADHVVASQGEAWIQIKDNNGAILSGQTYIETFADCAQNLLLLNFVEIEQLPKLNNIYLPLVVHQDSE